VDVLQITYNLIDTRHADPILPVAEEHGVGLLARMPYQRGILTGKFTSPDADISDHRARLQGDRFLTDLQTTEAFRDLGERRPGGLTELAMQYALAEPRISSVIPGARSIHQLETNLAAAAAPALSDAERTAIRRIRNSRNS
jgi:aryl-alcohol dehydrogenase-like predicted oxidoreductase